MENSINTPEETPKRGRPKIYTEKLARKICLKISTTSKGIKTLIKENPDFPAYSTVFKWLQEDDKRYFSDLYARAKEHQADILADEVIEIARTPRIGEVKRIEKDKDGSEKTIITRSDNVQRSKLMIESRQWLAAKLRPKKFGSKLDITTEGKPIDSLPSLRHLSFEELTRLADGPTGTDKKDSDDRTS